MSAERPSRLVTWRNTRVTGCSVGRLAATGSGWVAHGSEVLADGPDRLGCTFRVELDGEWRTRRAEVAAISADDVRSVVLVADGGHWSVDGVERPELAGCTDVDVAATPLTNTFPVRRLQGLEVGSALTLAVAWVDVPGLTVTRVAQTYRRLGERTWEYSDPTHGAFALEVDDDGLVVEYAGFATRV